MRYFLTYLAFGLFLTVAWNTQVQNECGRPMQFVGFITAPMLLPIFAPVIIWHGSKPTCDPKEPARHE